MEHPGSQRLPHSFPSEAAEAKLRCAHFRTGILGKQDCISNNSTGLQLMHVTEKKWGPNKFEHQENSAGTTLAWVYS